MPPFKDGDIIRFGYTVVVVRFGRFNVNRTEWDYESSYEHEHEVFGLYGETVDGKYWGHELPFRDGDEFTLIGRMPEDTERFKSETKKSGKEYRAKERKERKDREERERKRLEEYERMTPEQRKEYQEQRNREFEYILDPNKYAREAVMEALLKLQTK